MVLAQARPSVSDDRQIAIRTGRATVQRSPLRSGDRGVVGPLVPELQAQLSGSGQHDGRTQNSDGAHNDIEVGAALHAGLRAAVATSGRPVGGSRRTGETEVKVRGASVYLYRVVDTAGKTVDFYLSRHRDVNAAKAFLRKAMKAQRVPQRSR